MTDIATRIRERIAEVEHEDWCPQQIDPSEDCECFIQPRNQALRSVLDLHHGRPWDWGDGPDTDLAAKQDFCGPCAEVFPCGTVRVIAELFGISDSPAAAPAESQIPVHAAGEPTLTDPLIISIGQELAGRVWDPPLPKLPVGHWVGIVEVIARVVRDHDADQRWVAAERRADRADGGECA